MTKTIHFLSTCLLVALFFACGDNLKKEVVSEYSEGVPRKIHHVKWKGNEKIIVKETNYYPNGEVQIEGEYKDGQKHGKWIHWYENGEKWLEENYQNGIKHGESVVYYKSGDIEYEANYQNGVPHGEWTFWNVDGDKIKTVIYENGKKVDEKVYD